VTLRLENAVTRRRCRQLGRTTMMSPAAVAGSRSWRAPRAAFARFAQRLRWSRLAVRHRWSRCRRAADDTRADGSRVRGQACRWTAAAVGRATNAVATTHGRGEKLCAAMHHDPRPWTGREARWEKHREPQSTKMVLAGSPADQLTTPERAESAWTRGSVGHCLWSRRMHLDAT
jgi:hypothetical protein